MGAQVFEEKKSQLECEYKHNKEPDKMQIAQVLCKCEASWIKTQQAFDQML